MPAPTQLPALPREVLMIAESQWLFTEDELLRTPSIIDGLSPEKERENRGKGVNFILQVGIMLKLPQITLATASVFLHRFYMRHSMKGEANQQGFHHYEVGATSLFLATKVEENCRKMKELVISCVRVAQKDPHKIVDEQDREYWRWRDVILYNEDVMLEALCFDLSLEPPYKTLFDLLLRFGEGDHSSLRNAAWAFVNDSYLTMLCLMYPSRTIATGALYAAAKHCGVSFSDDEKGRPWWDVVGVELGEIWKACNYMADIYRGIPSKAGKEGGMYERLPETGDDLNDKTRARRVSGGCLQSSGGGGVDGEIISPVGSLAGKVKQTRRIRGDESEADLQPTINGANHAPKDIADEDGIGSPRKRQRVDRNTLPSNGVVKQPGEESNATNAEHSPAALPAKQQGVATQLNGTTFHSNQQTKESGLGSPSLEDGSEEGEVEA